MHAPVAHGRRRHIDATLHRDAAPLEGVGEHLLDVRLAQQGQVGKRSVPQRHVTEPGNHRPGAEVRLQPGGTVSAVKQVAGHAQRAQGLEGPWMHDHRPRGPEALRPALDDPYARPVVVRLQGGGQSGRAGADDQHVRARRHATATGRHQAQASAGAEAVDQARVRGSSSRRRPGRTR